MSRPWTRAQAAFLEGPCLRSHCHASIFIFEVVHIAKVPTIIAVVHVVLIILQSISTGFAGHLNVWSAPASLRLRHIRDHLVRLKGACTSISYERAFSAESAKSPYEEPLENSTCMKGDSLAENTQAEKCKLCHVTL